MISEATTMKMLKYSDEILEVIDHNDQFTRGDLQARIEAIVLTIMNEQQKIIHSYFEKISDDDLLNKEVELFWKEKMPLGLAIMQGPVKWLTTYRMELFKLVKLSGRAEISTKEAWTPMA